MVLFAHAVQAGDVAKELPPATDAQPAQRWSFSGWVEAGFTGNFDDPSDRQNFGRLLGRSFE